MADDVDLTGERTEQEILRAQQAAHYAASKQEVEATGNCLYCGEPCEGRFCDADCRDGWEHERKMRLRAGVAV